MPTEQVNGLIRFIGVVSQLGGALLLVALWALLRSHSHRREYFRQWGRAWLALVVAIISTAIRFLLVPNFDTRLLNAEFPGVRGAYAIYQFTKLLYFAFLVMGTATYVTGVKSWRLVVASVTVAAVCAAATVAWSPTISTVIMWQAPIAVAALSYCAWALLRIRRSRRSLGNRVTGTIFALTAVTWAVYLFAFNYRMLPAGSSLRTALELVARFNGYADLLLQMLLGYGMVVILMEDGKREVDDAHAELAVAHDQLRRVSLYDSLTGSLNRRAFDEGVGLEAAKSNFGSVAVLDGDNLKQVNDGYGHRMGDLLLQRVAMLMRTALAPTDRLYRWGGDEFLVVLPNTRAADAQLRLESALDAAAPLLVAGAEGGIPVLVSVGTADYAGGEEILAAIERADSRMYANKARRRSERAAAVAAATPSEEAAALTPVQGVA
ncbi:MAG TPA: GGDEF domain-containing protein [Gemmatimonadaceae bacterium]|nr:GGDEF domain-containing protein [Gemmatimonadaceae bacterium]